MSRSGPSPSPRLKVPNSEVPTGGKRPGRDWPRILRDAKMIDDESLLSAYLDGELDPAPRFEVETASLTAPRLAEELHELAGVRDVLAGLSRPGTPRDLAVAVCERIDGRRAPWTSRAAFAPAV